MQSVCVCISMCALCDCAMHPYRQEEVQILLLCKQGVQVMDYICAVYTTATPFSHTTHKLTTSNFFFVEPATNLNPDIVAYGGVEGRGGAVKPANEFSNMLNTAKLYTGMSLCLGELGCTFKRLRTSRPSSNGDTMKIKDDWIRRAINVSTLSNASHSRAIGSDSSEMRF